MSTDLIERPSREVSAGTRQNEARELAELQVKYTIARRFPRNQIDAIDRIEVAFGRIGLAQMAMFEFARGGSVVRGPSIRTLEAVALCWQNVESGYREISRGVGPDDVPFSEVEAWSIDLESGTSKRAQFIVPHWRDTRQGGYIIKESRDVTELVANIAQRRVRGCMQAVIPRDALDKAVEVADRAVKAGADTSAKAVANMLEMFAEYGVERQHIEKRIQRRLDTITPVQMLSLKKVYVALHDGVAEPSEFFPDLAPPPEASSAVETVKAAARGKKAPATPAPPSPPVQAEVPLTPPAAASTDAFVQAIASATDRDEALQIADRAIGTPGVDVESIGDAMRRHWGE